MYQISTLNCNRTSFFVLDNYKFAQPGLVPTKYETHGGEDVGIYAYGPMAHLFHSTHEQNYIAHVMAFASCVGDHKKYCDEKNIYDSFGNDAASVNVSIATTFVSILTFLLLSL